jgi:two-component system, OmpR family, heavy metal sensor histidine kinase CusS
MSSSFAARALDPRRWSLTARLAVFFTLALAAILFLLSALLYHELVNQLTEADEAELKRSLKVQEEIVEELAGKRLPDVWQREWIEHVNRGDRLLLRVLTPEGKVYSESPAMPAHADFPASTAKPRFRTFDQEGTARSLLLTSMPVSLASGEAWVIEGALNITKSRKILAAYWTRLCLLLLAAVVLAGTLGWLLVRRGLAPLRGIGKAIERINAEKLNERIGDQPWPAELQSLARAFDDMMGRLESSFVQLSRFSSDLAHEFRTPINNVVAAASVTLSRPRTDAEYQDTLAVIVQEGERLTRMVSSMLFLARAENAKQALQPERLSTGEEFEKVRDFFEALAEQHGVRIAASGDLPIHADAGLFRRALSNLIANALQHTPPGGEVRLEAREAPGGVEVSVTDTGKGIAAEHLPHLFDRFYRADLARSSSESSGLGLAVVKSILELHGGAVRVESVSGQGARFTLFFPSG